MAIPALDVEKLNQLTSRISELFNQYILGSPPELSEVENLSNEVKKFTAIPAKATALASLGSLYFLKGDFQNMQFQYKMAIRTNPTNELIRYNFASALYHSHHTKLALEQLNELLPYITQMPLWIDVYKLLERELQFPSCKALLQKMANLKMAQHPELKQWLTDKQNLLAAYEHLNIDLSMLHKLFDEIHHKLIPTFPLSVQVQHYYEEIDNTIYYVFVDHTSNSEKIFEHCMQLIEFVSEFEIRNGIDLKHFVMDYEGVAS